MDIFGTPQHSRLLELTGGLGVPYLADFYPQFEYDGIVAEYDGKKVHGLFERKGISQHRLVAYRDLQGLQKQQVLCLIQSWGYFSMIHSIFSKVLKLQWRPEMFLQSSSEPEKSGGDKPKYRWVSTRFLVRLLHIWRALAWELDDETLRKANGVIHNTLGDVRSFMLILGTWSIWDPSDHDDYAFEHMIRLSISIAGELLTLALSFGRNTSTATTLESLSLKSVWGQNPLLETRLLEAGWCPSEAFTLIDRGLSHTTLFYLALLDRQRLKKNHSRCMRSFRCTFETLDHNIYSTAHTRECAEGSSTIRENGKHHCEHVDMNHGELGRISRIVARGHTPVLTFEEIDPGVLIVAVRTAESETGEVEWLSTNEDVMQEDGQETYLFFEHAAIPLPGTHGPRPYVCISHVWADGLGNPVRNSIPRCQMLAIQNRVNHLYDPSKWPVPFWLDTICVPLEQKYRDMAIISMREIYRNADRVLVLDATLSEATTDAYPHELLTRITAGNWVRRLWTFQEAALAKMLYFQYADRALTIREISMKRKELEDQNDRNILHNLDHIGIKSHPEQLEHMLKHDTYFYPDTDVVFVEGMQTIWTLVFSQGQRKTFISDAEKLSSTVDGLSWRWTSSLEDETICLSGILDQDVTELVRIKPRHDDDVASQRRDVAERRMLSFISRFETVSPYIIFCKQERFTELGRRWLPKTFLGGGAWARLIASSEHAKATPQGLCLSSFVGLRFLEQLPCTPSGHRQRASPDGSTAEVYDSSKYENPLAGPGTFGLEKHISLIDTEPFHTGITTAGGALVDWPVYAHKEIAILFEKPLTIDHHFSRALVVSIYARTEGMICAKWEELVHVFHAQGREGDKVPLIPSEPMSESQVWRIS